MHAAVARPAGELWKAALAHAEGQLERERHDLAVQAEAVRAGLDATRQVSVQIEDMRRQNQVLEARYVALEKRCQQAERLFQPYRAEEFWDRVMQAIEPILPVEGTMTGHTVLDALHPDFRKEWLSHTEKWETKTLTKIIRVRSEHEEYFTMHEGGFSAGVGTTLPNVSLP